MFEEPRFENILALKANEILVPAEPGSPNIDEAYAAVGCALSMWESLEEELAVLFRDYLGTPSSAAMRAYGTIVSGKGRVGMLIEVIDATFGLTWPETAKLHTKAMNQIGILAGRRNEIAHGIVSNPTVNGEAFGYCVMPPSYNSVKTYSDGEYFSRISQKSPHSEWLHFFLSRGKYVYTSKEILKYAEMFKVAADDIRQAHLFLFSQQVKQRAEAGDASVQYHAGDERPATSQGQ